MIIFDESINSVQVDYRDYFIEDYENSEKLIEDIEKNVKLSTKDKQKIEKYFSRKH